VDTLRREIPRGQVDYCKAVLNLDIDAYKYYRTPKTGVSKVLRDFESEVDVDGIRRAFASGTFVQIIIAQIRRTLPLNKPAPITATNAAKRRFRATA
jgi:hypothetical protein